MCLYSASSSSAATRPSDLQEDLLQPEVNFNDGAGWFGNLSEDMDMDISTQMALMQDMVGRLGSPSIHGHSLNSSSVGKQYDTVNKTARIKLFVLLQTVPPSHNGVSTAVSSTGMQISDNMAVSAHIGTAAATEDDHEGDEPIDVDDIELNNAIMMSLQPSSGGASGEDNAMSVSAPVDSTAIHRDEGRDIDTVYTSDSPSNADGDSLELAILVAAGFDRASAESALRSCDNNVEQAAEVLLLQ